MLNIHLELEAPHVARFKRAKKIASTLCGITGKGLDVLDSKDIQDLYNSLLPVIARLEAQMTKRGLIKIGTKT